MGRKSLQIKKQKRFAQKMKLSQVFRVKLALQSLQQLLHHLSHLQAQSHLLTHLDHLGLLLAQLRLLTHLDHLGLLQASSEQAHDTIIGLDTTAYQYDCDVMDEFTRGQTVWRRSCFSFKVLNFLQKYVGIIKNVNPYGTRCTR